MNFDPMSLVLTFVFFLLFFGPYVRYRHERRLRRLAQCKLNIARSVTAMEKLLLSGEVKRGELCHDRIFEVMTIVQRLEHFPIPHLSASLDDQDRIFQKELSDELRNGESAAAKPLAVFVGNYFRAFQLDSPFRSKFEILKLLCMYAFSRIRRYGLRVVSRGLAITEPSVRLYRFVQTAFTAQSIRQTHISDHQHESIPANA